MVTKGITATPESIICEVIALNISEAIQGKENKSLPLFRFFNIYKEYTLLELIIKILNKIKF